MQIVDSVVHLITSAGGGWFSMKAFVERSAGIQDDGLHAIAGVVLQLSLAALFRMPVSRLTPWLVVLGLELANEWNDLQFGPPGAEASFGECIKDVLLTIFLPTLLLLVARKFPRVLKRG